MAFGANSKTRKNAYFFAGADIIIIYNSDDDTQYKRERFSRNIQQTLFVSVIVVVVVIDYRRHESALFGY